jgi:hypothetical protein
MVKPKDENPMTTLLVVHLSKFMRWLNGPLFMSLVVCKRKELFPFFLLLKSKWYNILARHLNVSIYMFVQNLFIGETFPFQLLLQIGMMERRPR